MIGAKPILGRIRLPARDGKLVPATIAGAGRGNHDRVAAIGHDAGRTQRLERVEHDARIGALGFRFVLRPFVGLGPDGGGRDVARRFFLQQQLGRLDHRIAVEAVAQASFEDGVGDGGDRHAGMVGHVVAARRHGRCPPARVRREIDRIVEAVPAKGAEPPQPGQVLHQFTRA